MSDRDSRPLRLRWAERRLAIIGPLLADPPERGELGARLEVLAARSWQHPTTGEAVRFGVSTLERWFYLAKATDNAVEALARKVPKHAGTQPSLSLALRRSIELLYREHSSWTFQLHYDNLKVLVDKDPDQGRLPSYPTVVRYMRSQGLLRKKKRGTRAEDALAQSTHAPREMRSFEVESVHGLWHLDFHQGSRKVLLPSGQWVTAFLLGILDDRSRLCCHLQWYLVTGLPDP